MKILLFGSNGQLGWELARSLQALGKVFSLNRQSCDLSKPELIPGIIDSVKPDAIINAGAYTAVDKAEDEEELATTINGISVGVMAEEAKKNNIFLLHYSTDYVFDGKKAEPYTEEDIPNPINAYGRSKLAGELAIKQVECDYHILRTTWVYSCRGNNFLKTILRLSKEGDEVDIVNDAYGAPTFARNLAEVSTLMLAKRIWQHSEGILEAPSGVYNATDTGETTWFGFAESILTAAKEKEILKLKSAFSIKPILSQECTLAAKRPKNSLLNGDKLLRDYGIRLPVWQNSLGLCLDELCLY
ncbi:MAG: dTDP-4-dehydrorhamnose reductase [Candidatus Thiodiazotropha sp. (ex Myrtea sp. 'scaly one' KF741663)]|nr:dTDP-4-dehydrorhamnose reductase [Candidatus Thiodiazotropha sp. (ex Myrtea sp. 'scaly one' KF741663)]